MSVVIAVAVSLVVGAGLGYGFRGLINRTGKKVEASAQADVTAVAKKL